MNGDNGSVISGSGWTLSQCDARALTFLEDSSVHCIMTSPPYYSLREYQGVTPSVWNEPLPNICVGLDTLYEDHSWVPVGSKQVHGDDTTGWLKKVGGAKFGGARTTKVNQGERCTACGAWKGCLGNEPTVDEYITHMVEVCDEFKRVLRPEGTLWLNIGDSYDPGTKQRLLVPHRLALALQDAGWIVRSDIIWAKGISFCRSYAGSIMPESVRDRPTCSHEHILMLAKQPKYWFDMEEVREDGVIPGGTLGAKGSVRRLAEEGVNARPAAYAIYDGKRNVRDVWAINTRPFRGAHFATFPEGLVEPVLRAGCPQVVCGGCGSPYRHVVERSPVPADIREQLAAARVRTRNVTGRGDGHTSYKPAKHYQRTILGDHFERECGCDASVAAAVGGIVLDPFCGSGTVGIVALRQGKRFIGTDASASYLREVAGPRLRGVGSADLPQPPVQAVVGHAADAGEE